MEISFQSPDFTLLSRNIELIVTRQEKYVKSSHSDFMFGKLKVIYFKIIIFNCLQYFILY